MPWIHAIFTETDQAKIAEHGISEDEIEQVISDPAEHSISRSSGLPVAQGWTEAGRWIVVVYRQLNSITWEIITAYQLT